MIKPNLTKEKIIEIILKLINIEKGDLNRLEDMLSRVREDKELYNSDKKYLESLNEESKEPPINLDKLRKSQPKPKLQKTKAIKFGVSHSQSRSTEAKIHKASCRYVQNSSQAGDIKWNYFHDFNSAKDCAAGYGANRYPCCCMRNFPFNIVAGSFFVSLIFGILGGLLAWYITRDYFPRLAKGWFVFSLIPTLLFLIGSPSWPFIK